MSPGHTRPRPRAGATPVYLEIGARRTFALAVDWPGWARAGKAEGDALAALAATASRYARVARLAHQRFDPDARLEVVERVAGNATTDFGAPGVIPRLDRRPPSAAEAPRLRSLVAAAWTAFDRVAARAPARLRKGPRGGGRDRDAIVAHVLAAERAYAAKIGQRLGEPAIDDGRAIGAHRRAILAALEAAASGPDRAASWPAAYAARRIAWHALDHAWEIEDRSA